MESKALAEIKRQIKQAIGQKGLTEKRLSAMRGKPKTEDWGRAQTSMKALQIQIKTLQNIYRCVEYAESK